LYNKKFENLSLYSIYVPFPMKLNFLILSEVEKFWLVLLWCWFSSFLYLWSTFCHNSVGVLFWIFLILEGGKIFLFRKFLWSRFWSQKSNYMFIICLSQPCTCCSVLILHFWTLVGRFSWGFIAKWRLCAICRKRMQMTFKYGLW